MKSLLNKRASMVSMAFIVTIAIAASLWFTVPAQAIFVTSTIPSSMTAGSTYSFDVQIDIEAGEAVNINNIKVTIKNSNGVEVRSVVFTPNGTITSQSGGIVSVTCILPGYSGTSNLYAYGYGYHVTADWGYHTYDPGVGAGYGYGEGSPNTTQLKYRITINTTGMAAGSYKALAAVEVSSTLSFTSQHYPLTITSAPGGPPPPEPGVTDVSDVVDEYGVFTDSVTAQSEDGNVSLTIEEGITGLTEEGEPISEISVVDMEEEDIPLPPTEGYVIGITYNIGPNGATFSSPITLTFTYDPDNLPDGVNEEDLVIAIWDEDAGEWVELPSVVDTENNTITATVSHFTTFAIVALPEEEVVPPVVTPPVVEEEEEEVVPPVVTPPVVEEEEEEEEEEVITPPVVEEEEEEEEVVTPVVEEEGLAWWIWLIVGLGSATVVGLLLYFLWYKPRRPPGYRRTD